MRVCTAFNFNKWPLNWILPVLIILCWQFPVIAFNSIDSLKTVLKKLEGGEKIDAFNALSWALKFSDSKSSIQYGESALTLARNLRDEERMIKALYHLSVGYSIRGKFATSNQYAEESLSLSRKLKDATGMGKALNVLGINGKEQGNYALSLQYLEEATGIFQMFQDTANLLKSEGNIANIYFMKGDYDNAITTYQKLVDFGKETRDTTLWSANLSNLGKLYYKLGDYAKALDCYFQSLNADIQSNDRFGQAKTYSDIGLIYKRLEMLDESKTVFLKAESILDKLGNTNELGATYNNLGTVYYRMENLDTALTYYKKALNLYEKNGIRTRGNALNNIATILLETGQKKEGIILLEEALSIDSILGRKSGTALHHIRFGSFFLAEQNLPKARHHLLKGYQQWKEIGQIKNLVTAAGHLSNLYEALGNYEEALKYRTEFKVLEDSIYSIKQQREITRVLVKEQLAEKEKALERMLADKDMVEKKASQNQLLLVVLILLIGAGLGWQLYRRRKVKIKQRRLKSQIALQQDDLKEVNKQKENLVSALEQKNLEVVFLSLTAIQKDNFIQQFSEKLKAFIQKNTDNKEAQYLAKFFHFQNVNSQEWVHFKTAFEQVSPNFFDHLFKLYPKLSNKELRHCALIRLNIPPKEVSEILGISMAGVHKARYRLRKRFQLERSQSLEWFLSSI